MWFICMKISLELLGAFQLNSIWYVAAMRVWLSHQISVPTNWFVVVAVDSCVHFSRTLYFLFFFVSFFLLIVEHQGVTLLCRNFVSWAFRIVRQISTRTIDFEAALACVWHIFGQITRTLILRCLSLSHDMMSLGQQRRKKNNTTTNTQFNSHAYFFFHSIIFCFSYPVGLKNWKCNHN